MTGKWHAVGDLWQRSPKSRSDAPRRDRQQALLNRHSHFIAKVPTGKGEVIDIHFVTLFSRAASPVKPLLLLHGWPGSFLEFLPMLDELAAKYSPATLPYHVVVPSLPGYLFSGSPPLDRDFGLEDVARIMDSLMVSVLGFGGVHYHCQGGDVGSRVCRILAAQYASCRGALLNYSPMPKPPSAPGERRLSAQETAGLERWEWFKTQGIGYAVVHATRPGTVGLALASSPLALLAWVAEKFLDWTDPTSFPPDSSPAEQALLALDPDEGRVSLRLVNEVLLSVSLYFLTDTPHRCLYSYRETYSADPQVPPRSSHAAPEYHVHAPKTLGFSWFQLDVAPVPLSWIATTGNLVWSRSHARGGHFAALECPRELLADLEEFVGLSRD